MNQADTIKNFIEKMDITVIDSLLDSNITYQDFEKKIFVAKLNNVFEKFKRSGDQYLNSYEGRCGICDITQRGYIFRGNNSKKYMSIIFKEENDRILDLFECSSFKTKHSAL